MIPGSENMQVGAGYAHTWAAKMWDRWKDLEREAEIGAQDGFLVLPSHNNLRRKPGERMSSLVSLRESVCLNPGIYLLVAAPCTHL